jgi:hypothetical protein
VGDPVSGASISPVSVRVDRLVTRVDIDDGVSDSHQLSLSAPVKLVLEDG